MVKIIGSDAVGIHIIQKIQEKKAKHEQDKVVKFFNIRLM